GGLRGGRKAGKASAALELSAVIISLAAAIGPCDAGALASGTLLGLVLVEHRLCRSLALGAELGAVVAAPLIGSEARRVGPAEMRHHIAGVKFVGPLGRLPIGPVMRLMQEGAERALLVLQPLDQRDRVVRGAAYPVAVFDKPLERVLALRHDETRLIVVGVAELTLEPA